jgi:Protein of unknown function (DUF3592)
MFNFIFESMQAYNQVGFFFGALVCLGIGGFILGNAFYWRVHANHASGTVIGVIPRGGTYVPVYRYTLPDGQTHVVKSDTGSSSVRGKETGRVVPLMISAHNPDEAREARSYLLEIIGLLFVAPGIWLGYTAVTAYPVTRMTWVVAIGMLVYFAERGYRILIPKGQRVSLEEWRKQRGRAPIDLADVKPIENIASAPDLQQAQQKQLQSYRKFAPFLWIFVAILIVIGIYQSIRISRLEAAGLRAQGQVVRLKSEHSSDSGGHDSYYAIVRFRTNRNVSYEFKDSVGSNPPSYRPGDKVTVLYLAGDPQQDVIIDRGLFWNWAIPAIIFLAAAFVALILIGIRRFNTPNRLASRGSTLVSANPGIK